LAIEHAISKGYNRIVVYGAIGGELDHTIANLALLAYYTQKGINIAFVDNNNIIFALHNGNFAFSSQAKGRISIFSYKDNAEGVCISGLLYELNNASLENITPLGVSNEFIGKESKISVEKGTLLIHTSKENFEKYLTIE